MQGLNSSEAEKPKIDIMWENSAEGLSILKKLKENKQAEEERRDAEIKEIRLKEQEKLEAFEHKKREKIQAERNSNIRKNLLWAAFWFLTLSPIWWEYLFYFTGPEFNSNIWCYVYLIGYFTVVFRLNFMLTLETDFITFHPLSFLTAIASFIMTFILCLNQNISLWFSAVDLLVIVIAIISANYKH